MKARSKLLTSLFAVFLLLFTAVSFAQEMVAAPKVRSQGSVSYMSGGVTGDERDAMKPLAQDCSLRMAFALNVGNYVADVKVKVQNGKGKTVLEVVSDGPWLYAQLPVGKYKVTAEYEGKAVTKPVSISPKKGSNLHFVWPGVKEKYDD